MSEIWKRYFWINIGLVLKTQCFRDNVMCLFIFTVTVRAWQVSKIVLEPLTDARAVSCSLFRVSCTRQSPVLDEIGATCAVTHSLTQALRKQIVLFGVHESWIGTENILQADVPTYKNINSFKYLLKALLNDEGIVESGLWILQYFYFDIWVTGTIE